MLGTIPRCMPVEIARKGRDLAERRRAHLVELYDTGRWKRYYSEEQFAVRMREAISLVDKWKRLAEQMDPLHATVADDFKLRATPVIPRREPGLDPAEPRRMIGREVAATEQVAPRWPFEAWP